MISTRLFKACIFTRVALTNKNTKHVSPTLPLKWGRMVLYRLACTIRLSSKDWKSDLTSYIYPFSRFKIQDPNLMRFNTGFLPSVGNHFGIHFVQWLVRYLHHFGLELDTWQGQDLMSLKNTPKRWFPMNMLCSVIFYVCSSWWQLHKLIPFMSLIKWGCCGTVSFILLIDHFLDSPSLNLLRCCEDDSTLNTSGSWKLEHQMWSPLST